MSSRKEVNEEVSELAKNNTYHNNIFLITRISRTIRVFEKTTLVRTVGYARSAALQLRWGVDFIPNMYAHF